MFDPRPILCSIAAGALAVLAAACGDNADAREDTARTAQRALGFEVQWVGRSFAGLPLTDVSHGENRAGFIYGDCTPTGDTGCAPPLQIQVSSICDNNALLLDIRPRSSVTARGVRVFDYEDMLELSTGESDLVVFAETPSLARRAIDALRPVNGPRRAKLAPPRYPRYYLAELRRVRDAYARSRSVRAVRDKLRISQSQVRFELALAREVGAKRLRAVGSDEPRLRAVKRDRLTSGDGPRHINCALEPAQ